MDTDITLIYEPTVIPIAEMGLRPEGLSQLVDYLRSRRPECLEETNAAPMSLLFPHGGYEDGAALSHNELLVELAGRGCYYSFGKKAGKKRNDKYLQRLYGEPGKIPHASVFYHAKITLFFGGLSRRVSHELIRHYVGADRSEEGSPSQESTRYTHHPGWFVVHPRDILHETVQDYQRAMESAYREYKLFLRREEQAYVKTHGKKPLGMDRKRIYEAAAQRLPGGAATSFFWTTNPVALVKMWRERIDYAADLEIQRFARLCRRVCVERWSNLFPETMKKEVADGR